MRRTRRTRLLVTCYSWHKQITARENFLSSHLSCYMSPGPDAGPEGAYIPPPLSKSTKDIVDALKKPSAKESKYVTSPPRNDTVTDHLPDYQGRPQTFPQGRALVSPWCLSFC